VALFASAVAAEEPAAPAGATVLENVRVLTVSGKPLEKGMVLLRGGRIVAVGETVEVPEGARRVDLGGRVLCPGFVDAASRIGLVTVDRDRPAGSPEAYVADAVDLRDEAFSHALGAGVTSVLLSPGTGAGTFAGRTCLVKTRPAGGNLAVVAHRDGPVKIALGSAGSRANSLQRAGATAAIRERFRRALEAADAVVKYGKDLPEFLEKAATYAAAGDAPEEGLLPMAVLQRLRRLDPEAREAARKDLRRRLGLKDPPKPPEVPKRPREPRTSDSDLLLQACARGEVAVRFEAHSIEELRGAAALAGEFGLRASVEGAAEASSVADAPASGALPTVVWPVMGRRGEGRSEAARVPGLLAAAGVPVSVGTGDVPPGTVRHLPLLAAHAAGRELARDAALRAITLDAARAAGFEKRIGSIEAGKDADLLVLDGDPLDLATRVIAVWIDGVEIPLPSDPEGGRVVARGGDHVVDAAVTNSGLMDAWTRGDAENASEDPQPFGAALHTGFGVDPFDRFVSEASNGGVLLRRVLPGASNPVGGIPARVVLSTTGGLTGPVSEERACAFSFTAAATRRERYPGSLAGLVRALESAFDTATGRRSEAFSGSDVALRLTEADLKVLRDLVEPAGGRAYLFAESEAEVRAALRLAGKRGLKAVLVGPRCGAAVVLDAARASLPSVTDLEVVMTLSPEDPLIVLRTPGLLADAGVRVRFGTAAQDAPPAALRFVAALAVRHGMERSAAYDAILSPEIDRSQLGSERIVNFDGDPLEPATRVVTAISSGNRKQPPSVSPGARAVVVPQVQTPKATTGDVGREVVALRVGHLFDGEKDLGPGVVLLLNGKIVSAGKDLPLPAAGEGIVLDRADAWAMPGWIDASSTTGITGGVSEETREVTPCVRPMRAWDPAAFEVRRALESGVTSVYLTPGSRNVVGGLASVVKTAPGVHGGARVVRAEAALQIAFGGDPSIGNFPSRGIPFSIYARRPTTRMGVLAVLRDAWILGRAAGEASPDADLAAMARAASGALPVRAVARHVEDIRTALRVGADLGFKPVLEGVAEGFVAADRLAAEKVPCVVGPLVHPAGGRGVEGTETALGNATVMHNAGVVFALATCGDSRRLRDQAALAVRYGLPRETALRAVTSVAADLCGVGERVGRLAAGCDGDVVVFDGDPLEPASKAVLVVVDGVVVVDGRKEVTR
jgi:imidazolonepropionase-like amidohydrolase